MSRTKPTVPRDPATSCRTGSNSPASGTQAQLYDDLFRHLQDLARDPGRTRTGHVDERGAWRHVERDGGRHVDVHRCPIYIYILNGRQSTHLSISLWKEIPMDEGTQIRQIQSHQPRTLKPILHMCVYIYIHIKETKSLVVILKQTCNISNHYPYMQTVKLNSIGPFWIKLCVKIRVLVTLLFYSKLHVSAWMQCLSVSGDVSIFSIPHLGFPRESTRMVHKLWNGGVLGVP